MTTMQRYWINQPSTTQEHHKLHGKRVLVNIETASERGIVTVYFTDNTPVISQDMNRLALSPGWPNEAN